MPGEPESSTRYSIGQLLSPEEVEVATRRHAEAQRKLVLGQWSLTTELSKEVFDAFENSDTGDLLCSYAMLNSAAGARLLVMSHQVNSHLHRALVPMWDKRCNQFVASLLTAPFACTFGRSGEPPALGMSIRLEGVKLENLARKCQVPTPEQAEKWFFEYPALAREMLRINALPTAPTEPAVASMSVTIVLPEPPPGCMVVMPAVH